MVIKIELKVWHVLCHECEQYTDYYALYEEDESGMKWPTGLFICDRCGATVTEEEFKKMLNPTRKCPFDLRW